MIYSKFCELLKRKEDKTLDFKITCDAFNSPKQTPKAELIKDICAMSNNGNVTSYIIIGVATNGNNFKSVANKKLTEGNIQSLCKLAIYPPPKITVFREYWTRAQDKHNGKIFVIIQIGPHAKQVFRLVQDFICYEEKLCYRRNEVWIRRGSTSDLATPEEIIQLGKGKFNKEIIKSEKCIEYAKLPREKQIEEMFKDFKKCIYEINGYVKGNRVILPIGRLKHIWAFNLLKDNDYKPSLFQNMGENWQFGHSVLFLCIGNIPKNSFPPSQNIHFKENWGWFTYCKLPAWYCGFEEQLPINKDYWPLIMLTLPNLKNTDKLRDSFLDLLQFLKTNQDMLEKICLTRSEINSNLRWWIRHNWNLKQTRGHKRVANLSEKRKLAQTILKLSASKSPSGFRLSKI